ncbi:MAG TPA: YndJ family transporter, partial [Candidatus Thermoplasmatota archaeon]|nr:YndJ family transporter [Candidatus Thermoplasmatota archaeon]
MRRLLAASAAGGALAWAAYAAARGAFGFDALFLVAPLALAPLALALVPTPDRRGRLPALMRAAAWLQPPAALACAASFLVSAGALAAALVVPWLLLTLLLALHGAGRFLARGPGPVEELAVDAALAYAPVGGAWLLASRLGMQPLGFGEPIVLLTAVHFHVAAFALLALAGAIGRAAMPARSEPLYRAAVAALVLGPLLLALGITFSRALEVAAALVMAAGLLLLLGVASAWRLAFLPLALAAVVSMGAAVMYATRGLPLDTMARAHGAVNLGIVAAGLVGMQLARATPRGPRGGIPFSALRSRGRTGPDFFERTGASEARPTPPTGLVDDLAAYRRADFDPERVAPAVRAFYERTQEHALLVVPRWNRLFRPLGRLYGLYALAVGQMCFPMEEAASGRRVRSIVVAVRADVDGRQNVRAWVRTYEDTGEPAYVAAYATHEERGQTYMNIAFPFPGWNLTSILRLEHLGEGGVLLTSRATPTTWGDQGVYVVGRRGRVRLPINETIRVWTKDGR